MMEEQGQVKLLSNSDPTTSIAQGIDHEQALPRIIVEVHFCSNKRPIIWIILAPTQTQLFRQWLSQGISWENRGNSEEQNQ